MRVTRYIRQHHIGLIALFVALTGTAYAGTQVASNQVNPQASKAKKKKKVQRGPAGPQGPQGDTGQPGSSAASINTGVVQTSTSFDGFGTPSGFSSGSETESLVQSRTPAGTSITARDLSLSRSSNAPIPGGITARATLHLNGADTALTCTIAVGGNACQDSSHSVTLPPNSPISMHIEFVGSGTFGGERWAFGWRVGP